MSRRPTVIVAVSAVALSLVAAGCGAGGGSPGIANLGSSTPATTATTQSDSGSGDNSPGGPGGGAGPQFRIAMNVGTADGAKFSACMREHGVTNFPDPNAQGVITIDSGMGIDPNSPAFHAARSVCQKLLPNGGQPTPAQIAQQQRALLAFSSCMRAHGLKDFPDPSNGGLRIQSRPGSDLDPNNPTFANARQACQKYLPFKPPKTGGG